ncbi:leucine-rich repeat transmembrane neuronal protein 2-like [Sitophilus oryzae]|uniref:Leucine-rich repeat transmembrane neuronal protein 2-like n=1 Tax=Sitophilus oryzae TaxID=7048 RepID=A0A6J2XD03_SITOR|nr:leucine-rich repeat transmembrane neuronal protein 2-like [Sitophilus oryzae]
MNKQIVLLVCYCFLSVYCCRWFKDITISAKDKENRSFNQTINSCIERVAFGGQTAKEIYVRHQAITSLGKDSVRNLIWLQTISFWGCPIVHITSKLFRNVPRLKNVQISYGNVKEIPRGAFEELPAMELLRIHNNQIDVIEDLAFANLVSLKSIQADSNKLEHWNREWFTNTTKLEIMNFQNNKIRTIPRRAFASLTNLRQIHFDHNEISIIHENAFEGIEYLVYLGLRSNRLKEIKLDMFPNQIRIKSLLLDSNYLNFLANEVLNKISAKDVTLDNNPWKCPCLDRIAYWVYKNNGTIRASSECAGGRIPVCAYPSTFSQTCLEHVDEDVTKKYLKNLKSLDPPLPEYCVLPD